MYNRPKPLTFLVKCTVIGLALGAAGGFACGFLFFIIGAVYGVVIGAILGAPYGLINGIAILILAAMGVDTDSRRHKTARTVTCLVLSLAINAFVFFGLKDQVDQFISMGALYGFPAVAISALMLAHWANTEYRRLPTFRQSMPWPPTNDPAAWPPAPRHK